MFLSGNFDQNEKEGSCQSGIGARKGRKEDWEREDDDVKERDGGVVKGVDVTLK